MKGTPSNLSYTDRIRSWVHTKAHGGTHGTSRRPDANQSSLLPISNPRTISSTQSQNTTSTGTNNNSNNNHNGSSNTNNNSNNSSNRSNHHSNAIPFPTFGGADYLGSGSGSGSNGEASTHAASPTDATDGSSPPPAASSPASGQGPVLDPGGAEEQQENNKISSGEEQEKEKEKKKKKKGGVIVRFLLTAKMILLHSKINLLLVFVPIGIIISQVPNVSPGLVFAMNALAIIPLAGLLSHATETVARRLGDTVGALLNVTFGNAVELIIFIALVKDEIRIVQASLLGSILSNLLLILGMSFLLGGLRFREQIYNSTVTQMSACLLSLSVISLVLPTAFHASFSSSTLADAQSLKISRGTSVILLLVYVVYLLFQLKSHAYMYESTPQHIIDEESTPGPVALWLEQSSSDSSSSSDSDSDDSGHSRETMTKRMRRVIRNKRRRKSSFVSTDVSEGVVLPPTRTPSFGTADISPVHDEHLFEEAVSPTNLFSRSASAEGNDDAVDDEKNHSHGKRRHRHHSKRHRKQKKKAHHAHLGSQEFSEQETIQENPEAGTASRGEPRRVDFAIAIVDTSDVGAAKEAGTSRRPFSGLRNVSLRPVAKNLAPPVFVSAPDTAIPSLPSGPVPRVRYGIRRTNSLPDRLNQYHAGAPGAMAPIKKPRVAATTSGALAGDAKPEDDEEEHLSQRTAVILLIISTALVALCAEFMVNSIDGLVATSSVGEIFIGLIILPIVGNAAEHVTAITVAMKNKMDLAIGVAVGSSIQVALFITPFVVILGWIMGREMTLYFTLFETVCLFVSTFIVNFLVLDGRSNYLEGALLCATYVIISVVAFFYPSSDQTSSWGN